MRAQETLVSRANDLDLGVAPQCNGLYEIALCGFENSTETARKHDVAQWLEKKREVGERQVGYAGL